MPRLDAPLLTPIYARLGDDEPSPSDSACYIIAGNGLFFRRRHAFFESCVKAAGWPSELAKQETYLNVRYPKLPSELLEQAIGFFDWAWLERGAEAIVLLAWDAERQAVALVVPNQTASSLCTWRGDLYPQNVKYEFPPPVSGRTLFADFHSHCDMTAYASSVDQDDEQYAAGMLHLIAGRLDRDPPQFHAEAVVDGVRFRVEPDAVLEPYHRRDPLFPPEWKLRHAVRYYGSGVSKENFHDRA